MDPNTPLERSSSTTKRALIISPHPDDEAIASGGLIAFLITRGWEVHVCVMSVGKCRQLSTGYTEPQVRLTELRNAQHVGGYEAEVLFGGDEFMHLDAVPRKRLCDALEDQIQNLRPELAVVPPASSYDQDHRATAEAAVTALRPRPTTLRHFVPTVLECDEPYWWRLDGNRPTPNLFVPLTQEELERKLLMVQAHVTQDRPDPFGRSTDNLRRYAALYGVEIGGGYAEAFRILRTRGDLLF